MRLIGFVALLAMMPLTAARAEVVINEIFYNAPDDRDDMQWIELHNTAAQAVDLSGWTLDEGKSFTFPAGTTSSRAATWWWRSIPTPSPGAITCRPSARSSDRSSGGRANRAAGCPGPAR